MELPRSRSRDKSSCFCGGPQADGPYTRELVPLGFPVPSSCRSSFRRAARPPAPPRPQLSPGSARLTLPLSRRRQEKGLFAPASRVRRGPRALPSSPLLLHAGTGAAGGGARSWCPRLLRELVAPRMAPALRLWLPQEDAGSRDYPLCSGAASAAGGALC